MNEEMSLEFLINITSDKLVKLKFWLNDPFHFMTMYIYISRSVKQLCHRATENELPVFSH